MDLIRCVARTIVAVLPLVCASYGAVVYAQQLPVERRIALLEIEGARHEERVHAVIARIDAIDKTLWWLVLATFGGSGVSGAVAVDRAMHRFRQRNGGIP